jgi:diaminopimelate epimerase
MRIDTRAGLIEAEVLRNSIRVKMTKPKKLERDITIKIDDKDYKVHFINTGVPHTVLFYDDLSNIDVNNLGRLIRFHNRFKPDGANVDFVHILDDKNIEVRTYERGVEAETLACGTGSIASGLITAIIKQLNGRKSINVKTMSGEILKVYFDIDSDNISNVWLEGRASKVFSGRISYV